MIVNLIQARQMFTLTLPNKVKGQYWLRGIDSSGKESELISIEAEDDKWIAKSNKKVSVLDANKNVVSAVEIQPQTFLNLQIENLEEQVILFAENSDISRQKMSKYVLKHTDTFTIGRTADSSFFYDNRFVSGRHATLSYNGNGWTISDDESTNGTYVNGYRVNSAALNPGDNIYIMGLRIVVGHNYFAINNPDGLLTISSNNILTYIPQKVEEKQDVFELPEKQYFFRAPRFFREIEKAEVKIDAPPSAPKQDTVPLALMLGPSITMGLTSLSTGLLTVSNVVSNGGKITQALPTLMMSVSMLLGTILWPIITKKNEKKNKIKNEKERQVKYLAYLDEVRDEIKRSNKEQSDILKENIISADECSDRIMETRINLWERVNGHSDFLKLRLGVGNLPSEVSVKYPEKKFTMEDDNLQNAMLSLATEPRELFNVPIGLSLVENNIAGLHGEKVFTVNMIKMLIVQMIALHSYDEVKVMLIADESEEATWDFVRYIPHFWSDDKSVRFLAFNQNEVKELSAYIDKNILPRALERNKSYSENSPYYVIISLSKKLSEKCEALQQLVKLGENKAFSILFVANELRDLPKETNVVVSLEDGNSRIYDRDDTSGKGISFVPDRINDAILNNLGRKIANIELDINSQKFALPSMMTFLEMFNVGKIEHLNPLTRWKENNPTISLQAPVGVDTYGELLSLDLHEKFHGPHGLVAGMTGSGKSEFIITYILSMAVNYHPDEVAFILIDYKGGGLAGAFEDEERGIKLPHLAGTITNLDGAAVKRSLISIQSELRRRQAIFNDARKISNEGTMDIYKYQQLYRDKVVTEPVPHLFIISDEFAELKAQQPEFMEQLISAARIGRSLGVHLILATQKPNGVVDDQIWSNSKFRVCLKVQEKADSQDMIKRPDAAELSQTGRFYLQVGFNELFALGQSAWCGAEYIPSDTVEKNVDKSIKVIDRSGRVIMGVKPAKKQVVQTNKIKQIVGVVKYLSDLASEEEITVRPLWLPQIPEYIYVDELESKYNTKSGGTILNPIVGEYDDPFNQKQNVLTVPFSSEGNCLVYGATGNGKSTFLTALCYSLIKNHSAKEVNLYIMDFGAETLKVFEKAPQVGGVLVSADEEKVTNLFKMLQKEIETRKTLFSEYGGDYASYCHNSGNIVPNIVVVMNNYSGFEEQYEDLVEMFSVLTRDGVKYGIYFIASASSVNAVRYRIQQNFKMMFTMQLNDVTDYQIIVGRTEGLVPSKYKGRGLVNLGKAYEFQTASCAKTADVQEYLRMYCKQLAEQAESFAIPVQVLPKLVNYDCVRMYIKGLENIPVGIGKKQLGVATVNLANKVVFPVVTQELYEAADFVREFAKVSHAIKKTCVVDAEQIVEAEDNAYQVITGNYENFVQDIFADMAGRNNVYKDANMGATVLDKYEEKVYIIVGLKRFYDQLSTDGKDKFNVLLEKGEAFFKLHFVLVDTVAQFNTLAYNGWYKRHITGTDGLWIGDGVADQYMLKVGKLTSELYEEIGAEYGYMIQRSKPTLVKLLSAKTEEEDV